MSECKSVVDTKVTTAPILYLPAGMETPAAVAAMHAQCGVQIAHLPKVIAQMGDVKPSDIPKEGLLYLPNPYVVPGGRFNEMYGWDTYFILLGLVSDHRVALAKGIVENFFFEIENYGAVLNANRTYFFTRVPASLSQLHDPGGVRGTGCITRKTTLGWQKRMTTPRETTRCGPHPRTRREQPGWRTTSISGPARCPRWRTTAPTTPT